mmetsp:Transcript_10307/g.30602  ORF Transcript_10307/g.30602 Transcript_10307/m.30602 type:complete len:291 (+) Transcript_10307:348-1220(+)
MGGSFVNSIGASPASLLVAIVAAVDVMSESFLKALSLPSVMARLGLELLRAGTLSRFAASAFAGVTRLHALSISSAANLFRMSSCKAALLSLSICRHCMSLSSFSFFFLSRGSRRFWVLFSARCAVSMAASTSRAVSSSVFFVAESSVVRLAMELSQWAAASRALALHSCTNWRLFVRHEWARSRSALVSSMIAFGSDLFGEVGISLGASSLAASSLAASGFASDGASAAGASSLAGASSSSPSGTSVSCRSSAADAGGGGLLTSWRSIEKSCAISRRRSPVSRDSSERF